MNQNIWGSSLWFSLHTISMNYPNYPNQVFDKSLTCMKRITTDANSQLIVYINQLKLASNANSNIIE